MNAKYGHTLTLAAFGALMFFAGLKAPDSLRAVVASAPAPGVSPAAAAAAASAVAASVPPAVPASAAPAAVATAAAASASAAGSASASAKADPVPLESLQIPVPPPAQGRYALQAAQFASEALADELGAQIRQQKLPYDHAVKTVDEGGKVWYLVPIGPYASLDEARAARSQVALRLKLDGALPAILLPPPPPPPAKS
jgi:septal ring-binding cell division protein DamX